MDTSILVLGASGQIGTELTQKLREIYGNDHVVASDIRTGNETLTQSGPFEIIDATDKDAILAVVKKYNIDHVYQLAAMLSATAEKHPHKAWDLNMNALFAVLDLAKEKEIKQVYWPSSIAVFGESTPKNETPQRTIMQPATVYGISKVSGEFWCDYYHKKYGVDVRSIRYPGVISWKTKPGGGTTDYAVDIFFKAIEKGKYDCFLSKDTKLPMMYMDDAVNATIQLMQADAKNLTTRKGYNIAAMSFCPEELATSIKAEIPDFTITYSPDFRQSIADSWPSSIDDSQAKKDWGWRPEFDLKKMTATMLSNIKLAQEFM